MVEQFARYTDEAHTAGIFIRPDGTPAVGPLPPNAGDIKAELEAFLAAGGVIEDYVVPPAPVPSSISDRQFFQQLAVVGIITEQQALDSNRGIIPPPMLEIINQMPVEAQFSAKMIVSGATIYNRNDPLTIGIGTAYGMSPEQIDEFFKAAAVL